MMVGRNDIFEGCGDYDEIARLKSLVLEAERNLREARGENAILTNAARGALEFMNTLAIERDGEEVWRDAYVWMRALRIALSGESKEEQNDE